MRINRIELKGFKPFKFANIKHLTIDVEEDIQIVMGQIGCGKSTLLNEITTFGTFKNMFEKNGYKKIDLDHEGNRYTLISDFGNKNKIHSFIRNGEDLNVGGTQPVQIELTERYLKFTNLVKDILYNKLQMCSMSKADRRSLLLSINPVDLSLVIEKHRQVCSKIREYKSNLNLLYRRKQEIEAQMLPKEVLEEKHKKLSNLKNTLQELSNLEYTVHSQLNMYKNASNNVKDHSRIYNLVKYGTAKDLGSYLGVFDLEKDINKLSYKYSIDKQQDKSQELAIAISNKNKEIEYFKTNIERSLKDIDNANKHLQDINNTKNVNVLENLLKELEKEYESYKHIEQPKVIIPKEEYEYYSTKVKSAINEVIMKFITFHPSKKIVTQNELRLCKVKASDVEYSYVQVYANHISRITRQIKEIEEQLSSMPGDPLEVIDQCNVCDYRKVWLNQKVILKERKEILERELVDYNKLYNTYSNGLGKLNWFINYQDTLYNFVNEIFTIISSTNFRISIDSIINRLNDNPEKFLFTINTIIDVYPEVYRKKQLELEIDKLHTQLRVMENTNLPSIDFIKEIISTSQKHIEANNNELNKVENEISVLNTELLGYREYNNLISKCYAISDIIHSCYDYVYIEASKSFYLDRLNDILDQKNKIIYETNVLEQELKDQDILIARYEKETIELIDKIEKEKKILEEIEFGLSPSTGFPHKNMVEYLNVLINNVNCILDSVVSYPLQLVPFTMEDTLDYGFKIIVDENEISDISKLSRGQRTFVNMAFIISFIMNMNLTDYPLFVDETVEGLDITHTQRALEWLKEVVDNKYVSQMFFVNHDAVMNSGFDGAASICLMSDNVQVPLNANQYVKIE